jgi:tetratricopeptide (TPR) repeat protein
VDSLNLLAARWYERSQDEERPGLERDEALARAADIARFISDYRPGEASLANDAGFLCRDASEALERRGSALVERALAGAPSLEAAAEEGLALLERARALMEQSYACYVRAADLSPDDARVINDTGLILTYYLRREPQTARAYHERAIAVGVPRLEAGGVDDDDDLYTAVGDAYQNLGYLELCWLGNAQAALAHLERSMSYAPGTRADVPAWLMPLARHVLEGRLDAATVVQAHLFAPTDRRQIEDRAQARRTMRAAFND